MYPNISGKKYINISTNRPVTVIEQDNDIITLDSGDIVSIAFILNKSMYDEYIDPATFFQTEQTLSLLSSKIMSIPEDHLNQLPQDGGGETSVAIVEGLSNINKDFMPATNESMIIADDPDYEYRQLQDKIRNMGYPVNDAVQNQTNALLNLIGEGVPEEAPATTVRFVEEPLYNPAQGVPQYEQKVQTYSAPQPDPITVMFNGAKRNVEFKLDLGINKLIPRLEFIELMEDSYNQSIISYLANEFAQELLNDPMAIREIIENGIREKVYGPDWKDKSAESVDQVAAVKEEKTTKTTKRSKATEKPVESPVEAKKTRARSAINKEEVKTAVAKSHAKKNNDVA